LSKSRWPGAPDVPTIDEAGVPGLYLPFWHGLWVPKGTPRDVVAKLNSAVVETLADPAMQKRRTELGVEIPPRNQQAPEALRAFLKGEIDKWRPIIEAANIKPDPEGGNAGDSREDYYENTAFSGCRRHCRHGWRHGCRRADLSEQAGHHHRAVRRRRTVRRASASPGRPNEDHARPTLPGGERHRRRRLN